MISKLPRWFWCGTWILAFIAGIVNVIGLLGFSHQTVSHLTGNTSMLAAAIATGDIPAAGQFGMVIGSFLVGAVCSGFIIQNSTLQLGHRYGVTMLLEALFLCAAVPWLKHESVYGIYCLACACGLQNAMVSTYSGTVVRTTHVSGMFTDLGIFMGHTLRGLPVDPKRLQMCCLVISGFLCGGLAGASGYHFFGYACLLIPAGITATASIAYEIYQFRNKTSAGSKPL
ncbi:MAG TPA: YoaK family protein [Verrucomicrobiae bacterium]|nr:YoaK family protein [Verrucomicrobiae bacterium]